LLSYQAKTIVIFTYDYLLSLSGEIELMWHGPFQFSTALYFIIRYLPFAGLVYDLIAIPTDSTKP
jgi:hypothetical protein